MYTLKSLLHNNGDSESVCLAIGLSMDHGMLSYTYTANTHTKAWFTNLTAIALLCIKLHLLTRDGKFDEFRTHYKINMCL